MVQRALKFMETHRLTIKPHNSRTHGVSPPKFYGRLSMKLPANPENFVTIVQRIHCCGSVYIPKLRKFCSFVSHIPSPSPLGMKFGVEALVGCGAVDRRSPSTPYFTPNYAT